MATTTAGSSGLWQLSRAGCNKLGSPLPHQGPCPLAQRDAERAQVAKAELGQIPAVGLDKWLLHHMPGKPCHFQCHLLCNALVVLATQDCPRARHEATTKVGADSLCNQCSRDLLLQRGLAAHNRLLFFFLGGGLGLLGKLVLAPLAAEAGPKQQARPSPCPLCGYLSLVQRPHRKKGSWQAGRPHRGHGEEDAHLHLQGRRLVGLTPSPWCLLGSGQPTSGWVLQRPSGRHVC